MSKFKSAIKFLGKDSTIMSTAFTFGFFSDFVLNDALESPLCEISRNTIYGFFYSIGASIVGDLLPQQIRFILPVTLASSILYNNIYKKKVTNIKPDNNKETNCEKKD